jgi:Homeodomain-like domain-containing protein
MPGLMPHYPVRLDAPQRYHCQRILRCHRSEQRHVLRAQIALLAEAGLPNMQIARAVGCTLPMVQKWRKRWALQGFALEDALRPGRPRVFSLGAARSGQGHRL